MFGPAIIVFREVLEAALIIAVVLTASRGIRGRGWWVSSGVAGGVIGACVVAYFADVLAGAFQGRGQDLLNAGIMFVAVGMLAWHNIWMSGHGRRLAQEVRAVGHDVSVGAKPLSVLALVALLAVLREGSETVLFLYAMASGSGAGFGTVAAGAAVGLAGGAAVGGLLYAGLLRIPVGAFFSVTGWLILLLAAGLAAGGAQFLAQAGLLPELTPQLWNTSHLLSQQGTVGTVLHILIGYNDRPSGIQGVFYLATLLAVGGGMIAVRRGTGGKARLSDESGTGAQPEPAE